MRMTQTRNTILKSPF